MTKDMLYVYSRDKEASLAEIITEMHKSWSSDRVIGIVYGPRRCRFVTLSECGLVGADGHPIPLDEPFEARLFNEQLELRWLHRQDGIGPAAIISETQRAINNYRCQEGYEVKKVPHSYLLWGESIGELSDEMAVSLSLGWSRLTEARIGHIDVPIYLGCDPGWRVQLRAIEYIAIYEEAVGSDADSANRLERHGNAAVIEERLISLDVCI